MATTVIPAPPIVSVESVPHALDADKLSLKRKQEMQRERRLKDAIRRYYALLELVETERGYLTDLRILVQVYLASLGAVSIPAVASRPSPPQHSFTSPPSHSDSPRSAYQYPPSSFTSVTREQEVKSRSRARPQSMFGLSSGTNNHYVPHTQGTANGHYTTYSEAARRRSGEMEWENGTDNRRPSSSSSSLAFGEVKSRPSFGGIGIGHARTRSAGVTVTSPTESSTSLGKRMTLGASGRRASGDAGTFSNAQQPLLAGAPLVSSPPGSRSSSPPPSSRSPAMRAATLPSPPSFVYPAYLSHGAALRAILTESERKILARSARGVLALHEKIVARIEKALADIGDQSRGKDRGKSGWKGKGKSLTEGTIMEEEVDAAVKAVCRVFVDEEVGFVSYEAFCAGHTAALDTTRRMLHSHANEWMEWEKKCAIAAVQEDLDLRLRREGEVDDVESPESPTANISRVRRAREKDAQLAREANSELGTRGSTAGLNLLDMDIPVTGLFMTEDIQLSSTLRRRHSTSDSSGNLRVSSSGNASLKHTKSDPTPPSTTHGHGHLHTHTSGHQLSVSTFANGGLPLGSSSALRQDEKAKERTREREKERVARMRLQFGDYLIKPVQRVCKYPLMFEQLRSHEKRAVDEHEEFVDENDMKTPTIATNAAKFFVSEGLSTASTRLQAPTPQKKSKNHAAFSLGGDSDEEDEEDEKSSEDSMSGCTTDEAIEKVLGSMRRVAHNVDEARRRRELENKSALIAERLLAGTPGNGSPPPGTLPLPDVGNQADEGSTEDGAPELESVSEIGHGGNYSLNSSPSKPPTRSLSFSAFSRSRTRSHFGRSGSFVHPYPSSYVQQAQNGGSQIKNHDRMDSRAAVSSATGRIQVSGPPSRPFLLSLGACLLAGSLDVVVSNLDNPSAAGNRRDAGRRDSILSLSGISANAGLATSATFPTTSSRDPVRVKYLAAFLYMGGYMILAKTPKAGVYEPRHWFALTDETIEIVDVQEEKSLLPCSFHLVFHSTGHRLELAAACQREKELWLNAIRHARRMPANWVFEPVPTLNVSANLIGSQLQRNSIDIPPVPSIPVNVEETLQHMPSSTTMRTDNTVKPNRRQSVNGSSMRAFFMHGSENVSAPPTVLIRRVSATRRAQTDRFLADVLSQPLLAARAHAKNHDEILFRDPVPPAQGNGIGVGAMAKNKLMARESVLVSKQCAPSICSSTASCELISDNSTQTVSTISTSVSVNSTATVLPRTPAKLRKKTPSRNSLGMLLTFLGVTPERDGDTQDNRSSKTTTSASRLAPPSGVSRQVSFSKSIKYRLFPGSLVPLTPIEPPKRRAMNSC